MNFKQIVTEHTCVHIYVQKDTQLLALILTAKNFANISFEW